MCLWRICCIFHLLCLRRLADSKSLVYLIEVVYLVDVTCLVFGGLGVFGMLEVCGPVYLVYLASMEYVAEWKLGVHVVYLVTAMWLVYSMHFVQLVIALCASGEFGIFDVGHVFGGCGVLSVFGIHYGSCAFGVFGAPGIFVHLVNVLSLLS